MVHSSRLVLSSTKGSLFASGTVVYRWFTLISWYLSLEMVHLPVLVLSVLLVHSTQLVLSTVTGSLWHGGAVGDIGSVARVEYKGTCTSILLLALFLLGCCCTTN